MFSDDLFEILKSSGRNKYSDPHIPDRVSNQSCFYEHCVHRVMGDLPKQAAVSDTRKKKKNSL